MGKCYNKSDTIGKRITQYRKRKDMTADDLGKKLNVSRQLVDKWEHDQRDCLPYIDQLCDVLAVDKNQLLFGISTKNIPVYADLGLSDCAIEELRRLNRFPKGKHTAIIDFDESCANTIQGVGYSPEENLHMINYLLSTVSGMKLLSLLYRYCFADFEKAYLHYDEPESDTEVNSLIFVNRSNPMGKTIVHTELLRYALLKGIENTIEELANNVKGDA